MAKTLVPRMPLRIAFAILGAIVALIGSSSRANAQVVQDCQPNQFLDRTAPGADRLLTWDFSISTDPERCLQVQVGQTVVWDGVQDVHPLAGSGGDSPNPISLHLNGAVTFTKVGTFGFVCLNHSSMKGAIKVVAAPSSVPVSSPWLVVSLTVLMLGSGLAVSVFRRRGSTTVG
jgi:hypothetical protein